MVGDSSLLVGFLSNGSGSAVKDEPLVVISWIVILDSNSVLMTTNVFMNRKSTTTLHSRSQLEPLSVSKWLLWELELLLVDEPSLVETVMAVVEDYMSVVSVGSTVNI